MPFRKNKVIVASAGSRKTSFLVEQALALPEKRILITTYTNENVDQIRSYLIEKNGSVPKNVSVLSWYSFLLTDGVRPYQNFTSARKRIARILFEEYPVGLRYVRKDNVEAYFLASDSIYKDRVSEFVCLCDDLSKGAVIRRIDKIYDHIFIDELQDLAGYDLDFLEKLFRANVGILAVGDPRQATFRTNNSRKNSAFRKGAILDWLNSRNGKVLTLEERIECYRSNQAICDFADALFPMFPRTKSMNNLATGHDGIFAISEDEVPAYAATHNPVALRYNRRAKTMNLKAYNIGAMKGRTFDRVLIFPTTKMKKYLETGDLSKAGDLEKLYIAVTRAKYSATFVR